MLFVSMLQHDFTPLITRTTFYCVHRILYWADQGGHGVRPKIASVSTDGSRRLILNQRRVDHPEYLARDDVTGDLFWSEGRKQQVNYSIFFI